MTWREWAACFASYNSDFFPTRLDDEFTPHIAQRARAACNTCQVIADCLDYALTTKPQYGVWGGKTIRELREMR